MNISAFALEDLIQEIQERTKSSVVGIIDTQGNNVFWRHGKFSEVNWLLDLAKIRNAEQYMHPEIDEDEDE
jgi:DNA mismatch repair ATPase MutS